MLSNSPAPGGDAVAEGEDAAPRWDIEPSDAGSLRSAFFLSTLLVAAAPSEGAELPVPTRPDLVEELLKQIQPLPGREAHCRTKILKHAGVIRKIEANLDVFSPATIKAETQQFHRALKKFKLQMRQLSPVARQFLFEDAQYDLLFGEIERVLEDVESASPIRFRGPKGAPRQRVSKLLAASSAKSLINSFSPASPTLTKDGLFFRAARLLFQVATGKSSDLTRYCRSVFLWSDS
jgi:hypothetical protein